MCDIGENGQCKRVDGPYLSATSLMVKTRDDNYVEIKSNSDLNNNDITPLMSHYGGYSLFIGRLYESANDPKLGPSHHLLHTSETNVFSKYTREAGLGDTKECIIFNLIRYQGEYTFKFEIYTQCTNFSIAHANDLIQALLQTWQNNGLEYITDRNHQLGERDFSDLNTIGDEFMSALERDFRRGLSGSNSISVYFIRRDREPESDTRLMC